MHPKPNMKKIMKADTMMDNSDYRASLDDCDYDVIPKDKNV